MAQLSAKHGVHQAMISEWMRQCVEELALVFPGKSEAKEGIREGELEKLHAKIGDFGRGRWMDNLFVEWLWRSLKYGCVYLHAFEIGTESRAGLTRWIGYRNTRRPALGAGLSNSERGLRRAKDQNGETGGLT